MPGINVSALSGGDLRRLLKVAHARHDGLLADRLEWEIAARATPGGHAPVSFAAPQDDDDEEEAVERIAAPDPEAFTPEPVLREPASTPRGVLLVTLGAVAGSLLSASVFWGLERLDMRPSLGPATAPQPPPAVAVMPPAHPAADQTVAVLAPEPLPPPLPAVAADAPVETALLVPAPPAKADPPKKPRKLNASVKTRAPPKTLKVASAERPARPPTLNEWLKSQPEEPIF
jgi:hypothetical protein